MATENLDDVSSDVLRRKMRLMKFLIGVFIGVALVWIVLIILDLVDNRKLELRNIGGLLAPVGMIWLPIFRLRKIRKEIMGREGQQEDKNS